MGTADSTFRACNFKKCDGRRASHYVTSYVYLGRWEVTERATVYACDEHTGDLDFDFGMLPERVAVTTRKDILGSLAEVLVDKPACGYSAVDEPPCAKPVEHMSVHKETLFRMSGESHEAVGWRRLVTAFACADHHVQMPSW